MIVAEIKFTPWDKSYFFDLNEYSLNIGDKVVVKTELGIEVGEVVCLPDIEEKGILDTKEKSEKQEKNCACSKDCQENCTCDLKPIIRLATAHDLGKQPGEDDKKEALRYVKQVKEKLELPMKFIDVHFSYDGSRLTFAFIADGRVDFRDIVKDLTRHFGKTIRLQQIGIRDEAKIMGDAGHCGRGLCCRGHLKNLESITSEMADLQQCAHRGSERISGICGRLMCCLAYEQEGYEMMQKTMPKIGTKVNVDGKRGIIRGQNILKQSVRVEFNNDKGDARTTVEVDLNRNKKKKEKEKDW